MLHSLLVISLIAIISYILYEWKIDLIVKRQNAFKNYNTLMSILSDAQQSAYSKVFREKILPYSLEKYRFASEELEAASKMYIDLTLEFAGESVINDLALIKGDKTCLYYDIASNLSELIIKHEMDSVIEKEDEVPPKIN